MSRGSEMDDEKKLVTLTELDVMEFAERRTMSQVEADLRTSIFRMGFSLGIHEGIGMHHLKVSNERMDADSDWRAGYEAGVKIGGEAMRQYKAMFGRGDGK